MRVLAIMMIMMVGSDVVWLTDFDAAKTQAAARHKYILLNFSGSDWCAPCIKLKKEVFESDEFAKLAEERFILIRADFPRTKKNQLVKELAQHNEVLAERYNPEGKFPYTLLLDAEGRVIKKWDGYVFASQDKYLAELDAASRK
jgi:thioredoxin-related protein